MPYTKILKGTIFKIKRPKFLDIEQIYVKIALDPNEYSQVTTVAGEPVLYGGVVSTPKEDKPEEFQLENGLWIPLFSISREASRTFGLPQEGDFVLLLEGDQLENTIALPLYKKTPDEDFKEVSVGKRLTRYLY